MKSSAATRAIALAALALGSPGDASQESLARRLGEIVEEHFLGAGSACSDDCTAEDILSRLDPESRLVVGPAPHLDFIRGLSPDVASPEVRLDPEGRAMVRIASFGRRTGREFTKAVEAASPSALVLDLRGNGGGHLESALEIAESFAPRGVLLLEIVGRRRVRRFENPIVARFTGFPVEVLVDEKTASSAEVLAWLLRHYNGARIAGTRTAGKGTVQEVFRVDARTRLVLTTGVYRLPDGRLLDGRGIEPDSKEFRE